MTDVRLTTHNLPGRVRTADDVIRDLAAGCDILTLNEARAHREHLDALPGWKTFVGTDPALTISWRDRAFRLVGYGCHWAYDDTYVGRWGAGPSTLKACWNPTVTLEVRKGGERLTIMAAHLAPSVTRRRPLTKAARLSWTKRREIYADEVGMIARVARASRLTNPFVVVGDFNASPSFPLLDPLRTIGGLSTVKTPPTHGSRQIDLAWVRAAGLSFLRTTGTPSDHRAVTWRVTL